MSGEQAIHQFLYILKSFGIWRSLAFALLFPFRRLAFLKDGASRVRREMRSHLMIYNVGLKARSGERKLSSGRKREIKQYFRRFGIKINTTWHETFFAANSIDSNYYLSEYIFYEFIEPAFNKRKRGESFTDKNFYSKRFEIRQPETFLRYMNGKFYDALYNQVDAKDGLKIVDKKSEHEKCIIKPSVESGAGRNVNLLSSGNGTLFLNDHQTTLDELLKLYERGFIIQERVKQYPALSAIYPHSLNTIKLTTFRFRNEIGIISALFRMGNHGHYLDNMGHGGFCCKIMENGELSDVAYNKDLQRCREHTYSDIPFCSLTIPGFRELQDSVRRLHKSLHDIAIASWDLAIDESGEPVLIEVNLKYQGILYQQVVGGPIFAGFTDDVLSFVFQKKTNITS